MRKKADILNMHQVYTEKKHTNRYSSLTYGVGDGLLSLLREDKRENRTETYADPQHVGQTWEQHCNKTRDRTDKAYEIIFA